MTKPSDSQLARARQGRMASLVIAGSMLFWIAAQALGPRMGLAGNYAILIDLIVMAALFWALVVSVRLWRNRHQP